MGVVNAAVIVLACIVGCVEKIRNGGQRKVNLSVNLRYVDLILRKLKGDSFGLAQKTGLFRVLRTVREIEILENTAHRLALCQSMRCFLRPTNRDKSPVWALLCEVGHLPDFLFRATQGETGHVRFCRSLALLLQF